MGKIASMFFMAAIVAGLGYADDYDGVRELLMAEKGGDIQYLSKINLGIPGGDNWIANRSDGYTYIYTVDGEKNVKFITLSSITELTEVRYWNANREYVDLEYDILRHIPGTNLGSKAAKFGDYIGDGIDRIFIVNPYNDSHCYIMGYDYSRREKIFPYTCGYRLSSAREPAPFGFYTHLGVNGIITHFWDYMNERYAWGFLAWDIVFQKYIEMAEMEENEVDYSMFYRSDEPLVWENRQNTNEPKTVEAAPVITETVQPIEAIVAEQPEETVLAVAEDGGKSGNFVIIIVIIAGVAAAAGAVVFLLVRRKKK